MEAEAARRGGADHRRRRAVPVREEGRHVEGMTYQPAAQARAPTNLPLLALRADIMCRRRSLAENALRCSLRPPAPSRRATLQYRSPRRARAAGCRRRTAALGCRGIV